MAREFDFGTHVGLSFLGEATSEFLVIGVPFYGDENYRSLASLDNIGFAMNVKSLFYLRAPSTKNPTQALLFRERYLNHLEGTIGHEWCQI